MRLKRILQVAVAFPLVVIGAIIVFIKEQVRGADS